MKSFVHSLQLPLIAVVVIYSISCGEKKSIEKLDIAATTPSDSVVTSVTITEAQFKNAGIKLGYLGIKQLSDVIKSSGTIEVPVQNYAQVSTYAGGVVKTILARESDYVKKGQTVIHLEHPDYIKLQQEYLNSKNNLLFLEKEYNRQKVLIDNNAGTGKVFQEAESKYSAEKGNLTAIENQLSILSISIEALNKGELTRTIALKAPISGYIGHINFSLGAYAEQNKILFDITDNSNLIVHINIFEKDIIKVSKGQKILISLPNQETYEISGEIFSIGKSVENETKTVTVKAIIRGNKQGLIPGMFVNVLIRLTLGDSQVIPASEVIRTGEKQFVFMATDQWCSNPDIKMTAMKISTPIKEMSTDSVALTYKMVEVKTGAASQGYVGITPVEKIADCVVVVKGAYYLMSQLKSGEMVGCCEPVEVKQ